jgi:hypothetical protein
MRSSNKQTPKSVEQMMWLALLTLCESPGLTTSHQALCRRLFTAIAGMLLLGLTTVTTFGGNPGILPIGSHPYGKTYGEWTAAWWQWGLGVPAANNPILDTTGASAGADQSGPVWFLGSTFGGSVERTLTIPAGKGIFMPVYQWIFGSCAGDCDPSNPGVPCDVPTLQASAAAAATSVQSMEVSIDGQSVNQVRDYRALSPGGFSVTLPDGNVLQLFGLPTPAGTYAPQVADGFWLMLAPLAAGNHLISVAVDPDPSFGSPFQVIYHIKIAPAPAAD